MKRLHISLVELEQQGVNCDFVPKFRQQLKKPKFRSNPANLQPRSNQQNAICDKLQAKLEKTAHEWRNNGIGGTSSEISFVAKFVRSAVGVWQKFSRNGISCGHKSANMSQHYLLPLWRLCLNTVKSDEYSCNKTERELNLHYSSNKLIVYCENCTVHCTYTTRVLYMYEHMIVSVIGLLKRLLLFIALDQCLEEIKLVLYWFCND